jgi:hypothetical protein
MDYRDMTPEQLVVFLTNLATAIANGKVPGWLAAQNTAISDALTDIAAILAAQNTSALELEAAFDEAASARNATFEQAIKMIGEAKLGVRSVDSAPSVYEALGFDPPDTTRTPTQPKDPSDLVAVPLSVGRNELRFKGNNPTGRITYVFEAKIGDTAPWAIVGTSTAQKWIHEGVIRGEYSDYRVRAQASRGVVSGWSNEAVCYGM